VVCKAASDVNVTNPLPEILQVSEFLIRSQHRRFCKGLAWAGFEAILCLEVDGQCYSCPLLDAVVGQPTVSVVVVCYNSAAYLPRCLKALSAQTLADFEIIVIDNASPEGELPPLEDVWPQLTLHCQRLETNIGFAAGNNLGARTARGEWLALLNPDAFPQADWLENLLEAARTRPNAFFASRQIQADRPGLLDGDGDIYFVGGLAQRRNFNVPLDPPGPPYQVFSACAAAALYPRQPFLEAGGFDEDYFAYHEDVDLGFRLRLQGLSCYLIPSAVVYHVGRGSSSQRSPLATYYGHRNLVWTYLKDMPSPWFWLYLPLHVTWALIAILYFVLRGQGRAILRAKVDALRGLRAVLGKRKSIQMGRRVKPGEVLRYMNRNLLGPLEGILDRTRPVAS
jgi:GT2 family glycosyltransferase